jgi:hypothetical protein
MNAKTIGNQFIERYTGISCAVRSSAERGWRFFELFDLIR